MRALLCHCKNYRSEVKRLSSTPNGIKPEVIKDKVIEAKSVIVALITVEQNDDVTKCADLLSIEIDKFCKDTGHNEVVIFPFCHLSNNLASTDVTLSLLDRLEIKLASHRPKRAHFGSDKKLLLDIFGHKGNVRYREFN